VLKGARRLLLIRSDRVLREYEIALGRNPTGPKHNHGDGRTPEGRYVLDWRIDDSKFHRALHVSYPHERDVESAHRAGLDVGGGVMIHGLPSGAGWVGGIHSDYDWTNGCIAVSNADMVDIWLMTAVNTPIDILP